jgi:pyruvate/2-oxoglutarate dehydrogenase complex dihydrolipoamide dehydrogenase (E3) component
VILLKRYEIFVIGGGTAGMAAAEYALKRGAAVAICEYRNLGGT